MIIIAVKMLIVSWCDDRSPAHS